MRKVLVVLLLIWACTFVYADIIQSYGFKAGLCMANQDFDYGDEMQLDTDNRYGFSAGVFVEAFQHSHFSAQIEMFYVQKGMHEESAWTDEYGNNVGTVESNQRVDYLSFPILGKWHYSLEKITPYVIVGPRMDILLGYSAESGFNTVYKDFEQVDWGATIGLGCEFTLANSPCLLAEIRYQPSFSNAYHTSLLDVKNEAWEFLIGMKF